MKKIIFLTISAAIYSLSTFAQQKTPETETIKSASAGKMEGDDIFSYVEEMPQPNYSLIQYLTQNVKFPADARAQGIEGRVLVKMIIDKNGNVTKAKVERGLFPSCDAEALRAVSAMPPWRPGKTGGKAVAVYYILPIKFALNNGPAAQPQLIPANK